MLSRTNNRPTCRHRRGIIASLLMMIPLAGCVTPDTPFLSSVAEEGIVANDDSPVDRDAAKQGPYPSTRLDDLTSKSDVYSPDYDGIIDLTGNRVRTVSHHEAVTRPLTHSSPLNHSRSTTNPQPIGTSVSTGSARSIGPALPSGTSRRVSTSAPRSVGRLLIVGQDDEDEDLTDGDSDNTTLNPLELRNLPNAESVEVEVNDNLISLTVREAPLNTVLGVIAQELDLNLISASDVTDEITITLNQVPLADALDVILSMANCSWTEHRGIIKVSKISEGPMTDPYSHGRVLRVYPLNFVSAADVQLAIEGMLSPIGHSFLLVSDPLNERKTMEQLIVEDIPVNIERIDQLVSQLDQAPRQVLIQAYILQVNLADDTRHGLNLNELPGLGDIEVTTTGFANPLSVPAGFVTIDGGNITALIELVKRTTDAKTLAAPKVMVINGQVSRVQIGERLGFQVTTTTETSTLQDVQFLEVGVVLDVTPQITNDGRVLLRVKPKVSGGQIEDGLPQEETTEVETAVMLEDGRGVVIGGLIQEFDDDRQAKLPLIGDLWGIGRLFQRRTRLKERREIIVALVPYIMHSGCHVDEHGESEWYRASTPLLNGPLHREHRPWEHQLPDAQLDPRRTRYDRILREAVPNLNDSHPHTFNYYFPPASQNDRYFPYQSFEPVTNDWIQIQDSHSATIPEVHFEDIRDQP